MAYELAMISTSQRFAVALFQEDALWIAQQHIKAEVARGQQERKPTKKEVMEVFDDFYAQTFKGVPVEHKRVPSDPIGFLSDRFIPSANLGTEQAPVKAVVVELRNPAQGNQGYTDVQEMCSAFRDIHQALLRAFAPVKRESELALDALHNGKKPKIVTLFWMKKGTDE